MCVCVFVVFVALLLVGRICSLGEDRALRCLAGVTELLFTCSGSDSSDQGLWEAGLQHLSLAPQIVSLDCLEVLLNLTTA